MPAYLPDVAQRPASTTGPEVDTGAAVHWLLHCSTQHVFCTAYVDKGCGKTKCSIFCCSLQLEHDAADVLQLEATFVPSIAYCVWYNFRQLNAKALNEESLSIMWHTAVHAFCKQQVTYAQFSALLAASPHAFPAENKQVEPLLLLQHFLAINAKALAVDRPSGHSRPQPNASAGQTDTESITFLWGSLDNATAPEDALLRSIQLTAQAMLGPEAAKLSHVVLVRSALLLLHLLGLVKMVTPGIGAVEETLWRTIDIIGEGLGPAAAGVRIADQDTGAEEEVDNLAMKLAGLLMPSLRSSGKGSGRRAAVCCKVLVALMDPSKPSLFPKVSSELLKLGELHACGY